MKGRGALAPSIAVPAAVVLALVAASGRSQESQEPSAPKYQDGAKLEQHEQMVADKRGHYGPADGGGSVRIVTQPDPPPECGATARYVLEYTAGPLGIAAGGSLFFQVSPFWGWTTPVPVTTGGKEPAANHSINNAANDGANTTVTCDSPATLLEAETIAPQCMVLRVTGAALPPAAKITLDYGGAGPIRVDTFAEAEEAFYFWADGDGDGTRKLIAADPHVAIAPGAAVDFTLTVPSEAATGGDFEVNVAFLDAVANSADFVGELELFGDGLALPPKLAFTAEQHGHQRFTAHAIEPGIRHVSARLAANPDAGERRSNPLLVSDHPRRVLWADLHGHSALSDGTGTPEDYYAYARDVAALDVAVLTDHDHWGLRKLDLEPALWQRIRETTARFDQPGRFTTLLGFEWTSWLYGHRHVLYFDGMGDVISSLDDATMTPQGLWAALREKKAVAITVPHHPAGGPVPIDWSIAPDPEFEPVVEIASVHGTSEEPRGPRVIYSPVKGHFVRDALAKGYQLGFVGSGDSHNGHPGNAHLAQPCGGLAAILASDNTRPALLAALKARTCYATTGPRILVWFRLGAARMGGSVPLPEPVKPADSGTTTAVSTYTALVVGTAPIERLDLVKNGAVVLSVAGEGSIEQHLEWRDEQRAPGDVVYLRAIQKDGHAAFASPIFTE